MLTAGYGATRIPVRSFWLLLIYASELLSRLQTKDREAILAGERDDHLLDAIAEVLVGSRAARRFSTMLSAMLRPQAVICGAVTPTAGGLRLPQAPGETITSGRPGSHSVRQ